MATQCLKTLKIFSSRFIYNKQLSSKSAICRLLSTDPVTNSNLNQQWNIYGSLYIQRPAIISKDPNPLEKEYSQLLSVIEYENSLLNDHELRHRSDQKQNKQKKGDEEAEGAALQTAQDLEDIWQAEFEKYAPVPRDTSGKGKHNEDVHSLKRLLDKNLILVVKSKKFGNWRLPSCLHQSGETIRQTAERVLPELFGSTLKAHIIGNAPVGVYKFKYSSKINKKTIPNEADGGKVFFLRAYYANGNVQLNTESSDISDYSWLCEEELFNLLKVNGEYLKAIQEFHLEETFTYVPSTIYMKKVSRRQQIKEKLSVS
ncbi:39S ribosomal protein L46, mitochondrial [Chamberlinius hualienensis]